MGTRGMDVLVTGATGYTGSGVVDALVAAGHRVSGLALRRVGRKLEERDIRGVRGDITDTGSVREATRGTEAIVHATLMHGKGAEEAENTVLGAVLDVLRGTGRTFVHNSGFWVTGDTFLAVSDGPHRAREIAEAASRAGGADGRVEAWPLDEALETLGDYACALVLDQRLSSERARRLLGWTPSAPSVFEELERGSCSQERSVTHYCRNGLAV